MRMAAPHTNGAGDSGDNYYNSGTGWRPIGPTYNATFKGNGYTIDNLFIHRQSYGGSYLGLFRELGGNGVITELGVRDAYITFTYPGEPANSGILVGLNNGRIAAAYTTGYIRGYIHISGLVGRNNHANAAIEASYSTATVVSDGAVGYAGGLAGHHHTGAITGSYYAGGSISGESNRIGGLVGERATTGTITDSYWDDSPAGVPATSAGSPNSAGKTTAELQNPTGYTGIYSAWNIDVDGDGNADDPWSFGTGSQYPALKYASHDPRRPGPAL